MNSQLTPESITSLADRLRTAYLEECLTGDCRCVTIEEHERNIAAAKAAGLDKKEAKGR